MIKSLSLGSKEYIPKILIANADNQESLAQMTQSTTVLISCVGPFRYYGTPVVKACISSETHYVDINGETEFVERSFFMLNKDALKNKVAIGKSNTTF